MEQYLFPFGAVPQGCHIAIYGAGKVGQTYLWELQETNYCHVVCMVDKEYWKYNGALPVPVCSLEELSKYNLDVVVIALKREDLAQEVCHILQEKIDIPVSRIVYNCHVLPDIYPSRVYPPMPLSARMQENTISLAVMIWGGIGDLIIMKSHVQEVASWDERIRICLYVVGHNLDFARVLYSDIAAVQVCLAPPERYFQEYMQYDIAFRFDPDPTIDKYDEVVLSDYAPELVAKMHMFSCKKAEYGVLVNGRDSAKHYRRCQKDGLNCYTSYNRYGVFKVEDWHVNIPMLPEAFIEYQKLGLPDKYVVLNYGWGYDKKNESKPSAKVWPFLNYCRLAELLNEMAPELTLVQIGTKETRRIPGCQIYILGESLEVVKYVLRDAALHVDCEGGMVHLATQLGTKCIVLFGQTPLHYYGYAVNDNIQAGECQDCLWLMDTPLQCYRGFDVPKCMAAITPEMVLEHASRWLPEISIGK